MRGRGGSAVLVKCWRALLIRIGPWPVIMA